METKDLVLNIAVNLGRFARWAVEGRRKRIEQFIMDTNDYMEKLEKAPKTQRFNQTFLLFKSNYASLIKEIRLDEDLAEEALTWSNILSHRAKTA